MEGVYVHTCRSPLVGFLVPAVYIIFIFGPGENCQIIQYGQFTILPQIHIRGYNPRGHYLLGYYLQGYYCIYTRCSPPIIALFYKCYVPYHLQILNSMTHFYFCLFGLIWSSTVHMTPQLCFVASLCICPSSAPLLKTYSLYLPQQHSSTTSNYICMYLLLLLPFCNLTLHICFSCSSASPSAIYFSPVPVLQPHFAYLLLLVLFCSFILHISSLASLLYPSLVLHPYPADLLCYGLTLHISSICFCSAPSLCIPLSHAPFNSLTLHISSTVLTVPVWRTNWLLFLLILRPLPCFCALPYTLPE